MQHSGGTRGTLVLAGQGVRHDQLAELLDKPMVAPQVVVTLGSGRLETHLHNATRWQKIDELRRKITHHDPVALAFLRDLDAEEARERGSDELLDRLRVADGLVDALQVLGNIMRLDRILGEDAAGRLFALRSLVDLAGYVRLGGSSLAELGVVEEHRLVRGTLYFDAPVGIEEQRLRDGVDDALRILWERDVDPRGPFDFANLAEKNV